uniref:Predicted dehydrogenase n=1 Tax=Candidatus Kentrum sp. FM TaxID=2126340 RepID=A0A450T4Q2_9GAMM|nr:MAG: Predicted dehydrogenase [Candidatus Kentron sp. FM]VFJ70145.1 MAG: Predicted dehydrogenase [Candidatus Kentron sp. FM]VFK14475.1 MAG: Predicted dehydrogenase [Candidatus Kentron sp. FM]
MMHDALDLGFIGGGLNSAVGDAHFIASQMDGRFRVEAGCFSRHTDINRQTAEKWHIPPRRCYPDMGRLLEDEKGRLDAIVVLTPTPAHVAPVVAALELGYAVICEKALAASVAEAKKITTVQREHRGFLAVTYNYTGYPMLRELRHWIGQRRLGRLEQIHIEMPQEGFARLDRDGHPIIPQQWRLADGDIPTLSLDLGVHLHHIIEFLSGEKPVELVAVQSSLGRFRQVIDNTVCIARYSNDLECNLWFGKAALGYRNGLKVRVFGERGAAEWSQVAPETFTYCDDKGRRSLIDRADVDARIACLPRYNRFKIGHPAGFIEAFANLYWDIAEAITAAREDRVHASEYVYGANDALEGLMMLTAMVRSSEKRGWVAIERESLR